CANGWSTIQIAAQRRLSICGVDYVPQMIEQAQRRLAAIGDVGSQVRFAVGNILDLAEADASYDKLIVIRVLINLGTWQNQLCAIKQCTRVARPGGLLLFSEATLQGWSRLNAFRREW